MLSPYCEPCVCTYSKAPKHDRGNPYIVRGYRRNFTGLWGCLQSMFMLTNETVNIWSHLFGVLWFLYALIDLNINVLPAYKLSTWWDHVLLTQLCISLLSCFLFSSLFHVFRCRSEQHFYFWYKMDLMGIATTIISSTVTAMYYAFNCFKLLRLFYTSTFLSLLLLNAYIQHTNKTRNDGIDVKAVFGYGCSVVFTFLPAVHWFVVTGGLKSTISCTALFNLLVTYALAGSGLVVYLTKFPEKCVPGCFDYVGASHQIWHFLIMFALMWWYSSAWFFVDLHLSGKVGCQDFPKYSTS